MLEVGAAEQPVVTEGPTGEWDSGTQKKVSQRKGVREGKRGILSQRCHRGDRTDLNKWLGAQKTLYRTLHQSACATNIHKTLASGQETNAYFSH